eukprot:COSAG06_NODE_9350_length_1923_cov_1.720943_1_plen_481_part_10
MSIYDDEGSAEGAPEAKDDLVVPDWGGGMATAKSGDSNSADAYNSVSVKPDTKKLGVVLGVFVVGCIAYSVLSGSDADEANGAGGDDYQPVASPYTAPPPPPPPPPPPTCTVPVPTVADGFYSQGAYGATSASLYCNPGFQPSPYGTTLECINNYWGQPGTCTAPACTTPPPLVQGGSYELQYVPGQGTHTARLMCQVGHTASAYGTTITCTNNVWPAAGRGTCAPSAGTVTPPPPPYGATCQADTLPIVAGGHYTIENIQGQMRAALTCNFGYDASVTGATIMCTNGGWGYAGTCTRENNAPPPPPPYIPPPPPPAASGCTARPPTVLNGHYDVETLFGRTSATLQCNAGYVPSAASITCTNDIWSHTGECVLGGSSPSPPAVNPPPPPTNPFGPPSPPATNPFLPPPPPPSATAAGQCTAMAPSVTNGHYTVIHLFSSSEATLSCNPGYTPSTNGGTIQCSNNVWTQAGHCTYGSGFTP